ncbi:hypothetical protein JCM19235_1322 [Vibrio maritimus]|uniref:YubB ferredoxin-like domain-containing protein n=1 Tax=Vibrio maritimus TaxID=990268 RepID=A0A090S667_9VIBR|nr:hypothetical protein JCM19235_1322 [Vibrio maritimus]
MPNHITNILTVDTDCPQKTHEALKSLVANDGSIDFNRITRMPKRCLKDGSWYAWACDNWGTKWNAYSYHFEDFSPMQQKRWHYSQKLNKPMFMGSYKPTCYVTRQRKKQFKKWLAENTLSSLEFDTAWSTCFPVFVGLSKKHPDVTLSITFADEDIGSNCGTFKLKAGDLIEENVAPNWNESNKEEKIFWCKFAMNVKGYDKEDVKSQLDAMESEGCFDPR